MDAPVELRKFAFLVGRWRCESRVKLPDGTLRTSRAEWHGRVILDGHAIADEYRQWGPDGALEQLGQNVRSYCRARRRFVMRWHDALAATWLELAPEDLGDVVFSDTSVTYLHHVPPGPVAVLFPPDALFRVRYEEIAPRSFTWRAAVSKDHGQTWDEVQVIVATREE